MSALTSYVPGESMAERGRLMLHLRVLRAFTEKYFRMAGIIPGMRVLDLGSGVGDVALLTADLVGPCGHVLGLDRDANGLERARQRAVEQGCSSWVSFQEIKLKEFSTDDQFDAMVGRYILPYQADAGSTIRHMLQFLKPGGVVVFHEVDFADLHSSYPACELWDRVYAMVIEAFRRAGVPPDFGRRLGKTFLDAGLPFPTILGEALVGGGRGSYLYPWLASTLSSVVPRMADLGLSLPEGVVADETLAARLEEACVAAGSQLMGPTQFGAWTRKPAMGLL